MITFVTTSQVGIIELGCLTCSPMYGIEICLHFIETNILKLKIIGICQDLK